MAPAAASEHEASEPGSIERLSELLAKDRIKSILRALSRGPLQPSQIERLTEIPHSTLYACLRDLTAAGLLCQRERDSFPRRVEYDLTDAGRAVSARAILTHRRQSRELSLDAPVPGEELADILRLIAPISRVLAGVKGVCLLCKRRPAAQVVELWLRVEDSCVELSEGRPMPDEAPLATIQASTSEWENVLLTGRAEHLKVDGDHELADAVLRALGDALC